MTAARSPEFVQWVAEARAVPLAEALDGRATGLKRGGGELVGPCPVCGGRDRFAAHPKKGIWNCRGCGKGGDVIALVEHLDGCDFLTACATLTGRPAPDGRGETEEEHAAREAALAARAAAHVKAEAEKEKAQHDFREAERRRLFGFWTRAQHVAGTLGEAYLAARGIPLPPARALAKALRFAPDMPYFEGEEVDARGKKRPRMIHRGPAQLAAITDAAGTFRGLHITWIDLDNPKNQFKAELFHPETGEALPAKKVRGSKQGNRIALLPAAAPDAPALIVGEGIETVLSVWAALARLGRDLSATAFWSSVDLGNLSGKAERHVPHPTQKVMSKNGFPLRARLVPGPVPDFASPALVIPDTCTRLVLLGDGDSDPFTTQMAMARAAARHAAPGREVRIAPAPEGLDFNTLLRGGEGRAA